MIRRALVVMFLIPFALVASASQEVPVVRHYELTISIEPADSVYHAEARVRLANLSTRPITKIPVLLYRLVRVAKVVDANSKSLPFRWAKSRDETRIHSKLELECASHRNGSSTRFVRTRSAACALLSVAKNFFVKSCCRWKSCAACDL